MALFHSTFSRFAARKQVLEACMQCVTDILMVQLPRHSVSAASQSCWLHLRAFSTESRPVASAALQPTAETLASTDTASLAEPSIQEGTDGRGLRQILAGWPNRCPSVPLEQQKILHVGVVGVPNAGKSTLTNQLIGSKVSAVSPKTNTTFAPMLGAFTEGAAQVVLHDTPGVVGSRHYRGPRHANRVRSAWTTARHCDLVLMVIDAHRQLTSRDERVFALVKEMAAGQDLGEAPPPALLLLNKIDKLEVNARQQQLQALTEEFNELHGFRHTFWLSAAKKYMGIPELKSFLLSSAVPGRWLLEEQQATDMPEWRLAEEVVRERVFLRLRQELPYELEVKTVEHRTLPDGSLLLKQQILVPTEIVRRMVVGARGSVVGEIGVTARRDLEKLFNGKVHLFIAVKTRP